MNQQLKELLLELYEYMDNKADAEGNTGNQEAKFLSRIEDELEK